MSVSMALMGNKPDVLIYTAVDTDDFDLALRFVREINLPQIGFKIGLEFFNHFGPEGLKRFIGAKSAIPSIFLDLKFHDIPNTVAGAVKAVASIEGIDYINIHASGGLEMMRAAKEAAGGRCKVLGVTVLTSLQTESLIQIGQGDDPADQVLRLARLTQQAGLDGIVCSPLEIKAVRAALGPDFILMTPGIRPENEAHDDQKRTLTPLEAIKAGADHLVIGRPITRATDPALAAYRILESIG